MSGIDLVTAERRRQVEKEGWTEGHDLQHDDDDLELAAACYALPERKRPKIQCSSQRGGFSSRGDAHWEQVEYWPWDPEWWKPTPKNRIRELVKAGALIVAAIDRLLANEEPAEVMGPPPETLGFGGLPLAYFDLEFTGLDPSIHDITEIALLLPSWSPQAVEATELETPGWTPEVIPGWGAWVVKVFPVDIASAVPFALQLNGYDEEVWRDQAVPLATAMRQFDRMLKMGMTMVGHNISLDLEFLRSSHARCRLPFDAKYKIDSSTLIWEHLTPLGLTKGNLHDACTVLGISNEGEHRALADALRCKAVVEAIRGGIKTFYVGPRIQQLEAGRESK